MTDLTPIQKQNRRNRSAGKARRAWHMTEDEVSQHWDYFWPKVDASASCWVWTASMKNSYGGFGVGRGERRRVGYAHRIAWEMLVGPIPTGMHLDHLCKNTLCVNPDHLEPVTPATNSQRGATGVPTGARNRSKTHCKWGHEFIEANTEVYLGRGYVERTCRTCHKNRGRKNG